MIDILKGDQRYFRQLLSGEQSQLEEALEGRDSAKEVISELLGAYERTCALYEGLFAERMALAAETEVDEHGLPNAKLLHQALEGMLKSRDYKRRPIPDADCLVEIDLSRFKEVNDVYGDAAGNYVIQNVPFELKKRLRDSDRVFHEHGDTFYVDMRGTDYAGARAAFEKMPDKLKFEYEGHTLQVGLHVGIAEKQPGDTIESIKQRANAELLESKRQKGAGR